jgi:hypothetical protein
MTEVWGVEEDAPTPSQKDKGAQMTMIRIIAQRLENGLLEISRPPEVKPRRGFPENFDSGPG